MTVSRRMAYRVYSDGRTGDPEIAQNPENMSSSVAAGIPAARSNRNELRRWGRGEDEKAEKADASTNMRGGRRGGG